MCRDEISYALLARIRADAEQIQKNAFEARECIDFEHDNMTLWKSRAEVTEEKLAEAEACCVRLAEAIRDLLECHAEGGFVQPDDDVLSNANAALSASGALKEKRCACDPHSLVNIKSGLCMKCGQTRTKGESK